MGDKLPYFLQALTSDVWCIRPDKLRVLCSILEMRSLGERTGQAEIEAAVAARPPAPPPGSTQVAVINMFGVVAQRLSVMERSSGGVDTEFVGKQLDAAVADPAVRAIVLNIDSPGGTHAGTQILADKVFAAHDKKRIVAVANSMAASAAYWIASSAHEVVAAPGAVLGSIGCMLVRQDITAAADKAGVKFTVFASGDRKATGNPVVPMTEDEAARIREFVDAGFASFVGAVARNRGLKAGDVKKRWGSGDVYTEDEAVSSGLADRVATLEQVVAKLGGNAAAAAAMRAELDRLSIE